MKNLIVTAILIFCTISLVAQDNVKATNDSLTAILIGAWDFEKVIDSNGEKLKQFKTEQGH